MTTPEPQTKRSGLQDLMCLLRAYWVPLLASALLLLGFSSLLSYYWVTWDEKDSYYSHGPLVPLLFCVMLWMGRKRLSAVKASSSWVGLPMLAISLALNTVGRALAWHWLSSVALFLAIFGTVLCILGVKWSKLLFAPVLFLITMVPMTPVALDMFTGRYQIVSTTIAAKFLQLTADGVVQSGNTIVASGLPCPLLVGGPCSGLKLFIALIMCSWFLAYVLEGAWWNRILLVGSSFPFSIIINSLRVLMIAYVGLWTGSEQAIRSFHDYSGYIALGVSAVMVLGLARLMGMRQFRTFDPPTHKDGVAATTTRLALNGPRLAGLCLLIALVLSQWGVHDLYELPKGHIDRHAIPSEVGSWRGRDMVIDDETRTKLAMGDLLSREYIDSHEPSTQVQVFIDAAYDTSAFHDPHICLPGHGLKIESQKIVTLEFDRPRKSLVKATILKTTDDYGAVGMVIYWYMLGRRSFPSTLELQWLNCRLRLRDLGRVVLNPFATRAIRKELQTRQLVWYRFSVQADDERTCERQLKAFVPAFIANVQRFGESN